MKKFFTLAAAVLASVAMMAADFNPTAVYKVGDQTTLGPQWKTGQNNKVDYFESGDTVIFSPYMLYQSAATGYQEWTGCAGSGSTGTTWNAMGCFKGSAAWFTSSAKAATTRSTRQYFYNVTNCSDVLILIKSGSSLTAALSAYEMNAGVIDSASVVSNTYKSGSNGILSLTGLNIAKTYRIVVNADKDSNCPYYEIAFVGPASTDPVLNVNPASIKLDVTAAVTNPSAKVVFSGKNLTAGTYGLTVPDLAGLTVTPTSVTVGEDGKLNDTITISYTSTVEVAAANTTIGLTIGALTKSVTVNYSAVLEKKYMKSINIEQAVLDNGTKYDIKGAFDAANIEYANIDALDTLNDLEKKDNRNYAFLGLKLKKTDAKLAGWIKAGSTAKFRFGNVGQAFVIKVNGLAADLETTSLANTSVDSTKAFTYAATEDAYIEIICSSTKTLVVKQIMVDADIAPVVLPAPNSYLVTCAEAENGTVEANWPNKKYRTPVGETVTLTITPAEGYKIAKVTAGDAILEPVEGVYSFVMPAQDITVAAEFSITTAIENTEAGMKAVKRIIDGKLVIEKKGVLYNAQGIVVK